MLISNDNDYWNGIPGERALAWSRVFIDFPPSFPGVVFMNLIHRSVKAGSPAGVPDWADAARAGEAVGMTPDHYYLLQPTLSVVPAEQYPRHPHRRRDPGTVERTHTPIDLTEWGHWVELVKSGTSPLRATRLVLSGGTEPPVGVMVWDDGRIETTDDA